MKNRSTNHGVLTVTLTLVVFALLICIRMPAIMLQGRFWAEEGTQFFANAWVARPLSALFTSYGGYLNLIANAAPLAARWLVPLAYAPYVTIATGLLFQLCPLLLLLTAPDPWLRPLHVRFAAVLLLLLVPASEEVWLQTLHCQFELLLCCAIILALDVAGGWRAGLRLGLLALAPLTGVVCISLVPLFLLRAAWDRSITRLVQALVLAFAALVQLLFFFHAIPGRGYALHPVLLLCVFTIRHLALPFLGVEVANTLATSIHESLQASQIPIFAVILPILVALPLTFATLWRGKVSPAAWFLAAGTLISVASYVGALGGVASLVSDVRGQGRYVIVPQSLFYLTVLALATLHRGWMKAAAWIVVVWFLSVGAYAFVNPSEIADQGPLWRNEVALWQADPRHVLQLWPSGWAMKLDPRHITASK